MGDKACAEFIFLCFAAMKRFFPSEGEGSAGISAREEKSQTKLGLLSSSPENSPQINPWRLQDDEAQWSRTLARVLWWPGGLRFSWVEMG